MNHQRHVHTVVGVFDDYHGHLCAKNNVKDMSKDLWQVSRDFAELLNRKTLYQPVSAIGKFYHEFQMVWECCTERSTLVQASACP